ncbi:MAG TPA: glycosyltransferase family 39 protein [Thermoanaerobaculia bacterium]|jgi:4-amino-4-deoxy-L-arabinose transferase-like glycosyltransferase
MEPGSTVARATPGWGGILAAWALLAGLSLALRPLLPVDETRYAAVAWEMWTRGDLLVPHLNGRPYSDKPPLLFWLIHLGWRIFGVNEVWPRLVPALFSLANLFLTGALARRLWPDRPALARAAPAVLVGLLLWSVFTGMLMFDMLVAFCVLLALLGLHGAWSRGGALAWLQVGAALGLGVLAKGPVVFLAPLFVAVLAPWWGGRRPGWRWWLGIAAAMVVAAAIALAWALPAMRAGGATYANAILFSQTEERMVYSFAHRRPWWWYLALLPAFLYPYAFWPPLWRALARLRPLSADPGTRFCLSWMLPTLAAFSLISGKQPHYLLPLIPAFALLAARLLDAPAPAPRRWTLLPALSGVLLVAAALATAPFVVDRYRLPRWAGQVSPVAGLLLGLAALACIPLFDRIFVRRTAAPTLLTLLGMTALYAGCAGAIRRNYDVAPIARYLAVAEREGRPIGYVGIYHGEFHFAGRLKRPFEQIPPGAEWRWIEEHPRGRVVQDMDSLPYWMPRAAFTHPYRTDVLAVWGRESLPPAPSG